MKLTMQITLKRNLLEEVGWVKESVVEAVAPAAETTENVTDDSEE